MSGGREFRSANGFLPIGSPLKSRLALGWLKGPCDNSNNRIRSMKNSSKTSVRRVGMENAGQMNLISHGGPQAGHRGWEIFGPDRGRAQRGHEKTATVHRVHVSLPGKKTGLKNFPPVRITLFSI